MSASGISLCTGAFDAVADRTAAGASAFGCGAATGSVFQLKSISSVFSTAFWSGYSDTFHLISSNTGRSLGASAGSAFGCGAFAGSAFSVVCCTGAVCTGAGTSSTGVPHCMQNFASAASSFPQFLQYISSSFWIFSISDLFFDQRFQFFRCIFFPPPASVPAKILWRICRYCLFCIHVQSTQPCKKIQVR